MTHAIVPNLTPREVAELAYAPRRAVEKAIEEKALSVRIGRLRSGHLGKVWPARRLLGPESVAYMVLIRHLSGDLVLTKASKRRLAKKLKGRDWAALKTAKVELAPAVIADVGQVAGAALDHAGRYIKARDRWIESVDGIKGGLPIIKGTRITVHSVAARMAAGDALAAIAAENPDLPLEAFETAALFAKANPLSGRPTGLPPRTA